MMQRLSLFGTMLMLILMLGACSSGDDDAAVDTKAIDEDVANANTNEEKASDIEITDFIINSTTAEMKKMQFVQDAAIKKSYDTVSLALVVESALNYETAKSYADSFVRTFADFAGSRPTKDYFGEVYDQYDLFITVVDLNDTKILSGSKVHTNKAINWD